MVSKVLIALCLTVAVALAVPAQPAAPGGFGPPAWVAGGGANPWLPPWVAAAQPAASGGFGPPAWGAGGGANPWLPPWVAAAPWYPKWEPCTTIGKECLDCNTKVVCTKIGGIQRVCSDPTMPYCNLGECSATPTAECAPPAVPASQTV